MASFLSVPVDAEASIGTLGPELIRVIGVVEVDGTAIYRIIQGNKNKDKTKTKQKQKQNKSKRGPIKGNKTKTKQKQPRRSEQKHLTPTKSALKGAWPL